MILMVNHAAISGIGLGTRSVSREPCERSDRCGLARACLRWTKICGSILLRCHREVCWLFAAQTGKQLLRPPPLCADSALKASFTFACPTDRIPVAGHFVRSANF